LKSSPHDATTPPAPSFRQFPARPECSPRPTTCGVRAGRRVQWFTREQRNSISSSLAFITLEMLLVHSPAPLLSLRWRCCWCTLQLPCFHYAGDAAGALSSSLAFITLEMLHGTVPSLSGHGTVQCGAVWSRHGEVWSRHGAVRSVPCGAVAARRSVVTLCVVRLRHSAVRLRHSAVRLRHSAVRSLQGAMRSLRQHSRQGRFLPQCTHDQFLLGSSTQQLLHNLVCCACLPSAAGLLLSLCCFLVACASACAPQMRRWPRLARRPPPRMPLPPPHA
jgi:hypothetical protein